MIGCDVRLVLLDLCGWHCVLCLEMEMGLGFPFCACATLVPLCRSDTRYLFFHFSEWRSLLN